MLSDCGLSVLPTHTFATCPPLDLLCVPGGRSGVVNAMGDRDTIEFVRRQAGAAVRDVRVCGAFILGVARVAQGRRATTRWAFTELLPLVGATYEQARIVQDGKVITAGGVTSGSTSASAWRPRSPGENVARAIEHEHRVRPGSSVRLRPSRSCARRRRGDRVPSV